MKKIIIQYFLVCICVSACAIKPQKDFIAKSSDMNLLYEEMYIQASTGDSI